MDAGPSLSDRREQSRRRNRLLVIGGIAALVIVGALVAVLALDGSGNTTKKQATPTTSVHTTVTLTAGNVSADSAGPGIAVTPEQAQEVVAAIRTYVNTATVQPLRTGQPAGDLSSVFDSGTLARVTGPDRAVMTDEGLPKITGDLTVTGTPIAIVGLGDQQGKLILVSATLQLAVDGKVAGSKQPVHIERHGDLVLAPNGFGGWRVTSYNVAVSRSGAGVDVTTTLPATSKLPATTKKGTK